MTGGAPAAVETGASSVGAPAGAPARRSGDARLRIAIGAVALVGVALATYLVYIHYAGLKPICAFSGGCEKVQTSVYSKLAGIPVADLGLLGYLALLATLFVPGENGRFAGAVVALAGFGFSAYLTYREIFTIKAICQWCVGSAVLMTVLAGLTVWRLLRAEPAPVAAEAPLEA